MVVFVDKSGKTVYVATRKLRKEGNSIAVSLPKNGFRECGLDPDSIANGKAFIEFKLTEEGKLVITIRMG